MPLNEFGDDFSDDFAIEEQKRIIKIKPIYYIVGGILFLGGLILILLKTIL